jgi:hypothetical protein
VYKRTLARCVIALALSFLLMGAKCPSIPDTHEIHVTVATEEAIDLEFGAHGGIDATGGGEVIDLEELWELLDDADIDVERLQYMKVSSVLYGVTAYNESETDREIVNGRVTVSRGASGPSAVLIDDLDAAVYPLLGKLVQAPISEEGIDLINGLLEDVVTALKTGTPGNLVLIGTVEGSTEPPGGDIDFDWRLRINYQIAGGVPVDSPEF